MTIEINNLTTSQIDEKFIQRIAQEVLGGEGKEEDLSIALIGPGRMRGLNRKYLRKNRVTDVLAFPEPKIFPEISGKNFLGEILICLREVKKNAKRFQTNFEKELARVLIHGILHLLGYQHETGGEKEKKMREKEEYYLSKFFN